MTRFSAVFLLLLASGLSSAGPVGERQRPYVWLGPMPQAGECPQEYVPVRDAHGNIYSNPCTAVEKGVRVTWNTTS